jgi:Flp pilus assembly protein TadD
VNRTSSFSFWERWAMRPCSGLLRILLACLFVASFASSLQAQAAAGRLTGTISDEDGKPIVGATFECENKVATPSSFTAKTDSKGWFSMIGMQASRMVGAWNCRSSAVGFMSADARITVESLGKQSRLDITLKKGGGALSGLTAAATKAIQGDLKAADDLFAARQWDAAIEKYRALMAKAPTLTAINLQIGSCYRNKKEYDNAIAAYNELLKTDPNNEAARVGIGMTSFEKGDLKAADATLTGIAQTAGASKEVFYSLGEVKLGEGEADEAGRWYQKAADADPAWGKPLFKLGVVALNKGDKDGALKMLEKVLAVDPSSGEAAQAKAIIAQLQK